MYRGDCVSGAVLGVDDVVVVVVVVAGVDAVVAVAAEQHVGAVAAEQQVGPGAAVEPLWRAAGDGREDVVSGAAAWHASPG